MLEVEGKGRDVAQTNCAKDCPFQHNNRTTALYPSVYLFKYSRKVKTENPNPADKKVLVYQSGTSLQKKTS